MISISAFACPHCGELLREKRPIGHVGRFVVEAGITLGVLAGVLRGSEWFVALIVIPLALLLSRAARIRLFGHTLESATESGHIPLGE